MFRYKTVLMKKILFLLTTVMVTAQYTNAQPLNATEMLEMLACKDYACFSKLIEPKGYEVALNKETHGYQTYQYKSKLTYQNESNAAIALPYTVAFTVQTDDKSTTLSHTVGNQEQRELLLTDFKVQGFEYVEGTKSKSTYDNNAVVYKSKAHPLITLKVTSFEKKDRKKTYLEYEFELWRPNANHPDKIKDSAARKLDSATRKL